MKLYKFLTVLFLACFTQAALAQERGTLSGSLADEKGAGISYANVAVMASADSSLVTGAVTDGEGKFSIPSPEAGTYFLRMSAIGFAQTTSPVFTISGKTFTKDFGTFTLKEDVQVLDEVSVVSMRPTIVNEADKMIVSVEGTALAAGSTAFEVLAKSPGVWIDQDGNIQLNGQSGVRVMLDGRLTYLSAKELQNLLEGMSAENIKNIEIINNPSSKYDAEGTSGIININLKKNTLSGINGSVYTSYQYNGLHGYSGGGTLNYKKGKWSSFINVDAAERARFRDAIFIREFNTPTSSTTFDQEAWEDINRFTPSVRMGTDFDINEQHSIGVMANISYQEGGHDFQTDTYIRNGNEGQALYIDSRNLISNVYQNGTFNFHYLGKLDTLGTTLSADLDFVRIMDEGDARFQNHYDSLAAGAGDFSNILTTENPTNYDIYSAKVDYSQPLTGNRKLEFGLKASRVISDNDLQFYIGEGEEKLLDKSRSNHFIYEEDIYAAYANFSTPLGENWSVQAGLRAEQTVAEGLSLTTNEETPREYLDLFPSLFVQQKVSDNYQISYNYSRRINRPHYEMLNPFVFYLDPYSMAKGNPYLKPQYSHSFGVTQTYKQMYTLVLEYTKTLDFIAEVPNLNDETKETIFLRSNVDDADNTSATFVAPFKIMKNWDTNNNATFAYQRFSTMQNNELLKNNQFFYMFQSTHNIMLPLKIRMELNGGYQGPGVWGLYRIKGQWWLDAGLKRSFMEDKLDLSMSVSDIFKSRWVHGSANFSDDINEFKQYFGARSLNLSLRYRFTKGEKFEMKKRNTNLEELNRTGG